MAAGGTDAIPQWGIMDSLNKWLASLGDNPIVQLLAFILMFLIRIEADRWQRRRAERKAKKHKGVAHG